MDGKEESPGGTQHLRVRHPCCSARAAIAGAILAVLILLTVSSPVSATDPGFPTVFSIGTPAVFQDIFEPNDFLLVFPYDITYDNSQPGTPASLLFTYRLMSEDGKDTLASAVPYPYNNSGYGQGTVAIYFTAADAPAWEGLYIIRIDGNPMYWVTPPTAATHTLSAAEYSSLASQPGALASYIMGQAASLEINWGVKLYDTNGSGGAALTSTGQTYFTTVIPGLNTVCPGIMAVSVSTPTWTDSTTPGTSAAAAWVNQWAGTGVIERLTTWGNAMGGLPWQSVSGAIICVIGVALGGYSQKKFGVGDPGFLAGGILLVIGTFAGFIYWAIIGGVMIVLAFYIMQTQWWRNN